MPRALFDASPAALRRFESYFSEASRSRGVRYAAQGRVTIADATHDWLAADVRGTEVYEVEIHDEGAALHASCTCPHFAGSGVPCKHLWATLLVAAGDDALPGLETARKLVFDYDDRPPADELDDEDDRGAPVAPILPSPAPKRRSAPPAWRDVLSRTPSSPAATPGRRTRELHFVIDADATRLHDQLAVWVVEHVAAGARAGWRPAVLQRPFGPFVDAESAMTLGMLDGLSATTPGSAFASSARHPTISFPSSRRPACSSACAPPAARTSVRPTVLPFDGTPPPMRSRSRSRRPRRARGGASAPGSNAGRSASP